MHLRRAFAGLVVAVLAMGVVSAGKRDRTRPRPQFAPAPAEDGSGPALKGATWVVDTDNFVARLEQLDDAARWKFLQERAGAHSDPFVDRNPSSPGFLTFLLHLESKADGALVLQPQRCRLRTNLSEFRHPMDMPMIETTYAAIDAEVPATYRAVAPALLDGEIILHPGQHATGLLVYRGVKPNTKSFVVEVLVTTPAGEIDEFRAPYRRVKTSKKKGR